MSDPGSWLETLAKLRETRVPCAMVVVTGVRGSAPREVGARMLVAGGRLAWGTIGGGKLEHLAIERALALVAAGERAGESVIFPLGEKAGQCCGGEVTLFFECFTWKRRKIVVFGAGHVAQALGALAPHLSADVLLIDPRSEEEIEPRLPHTRPYEVLFVDAPEEEIDRIPPNSLVLIMTHSHALDLEILARALSRGGFPYVGLIGSERKWSRFRSRLEQRGFTAEAIASVRSPIGLVRGSKEPGAIAISAAAELVQVMGELESRQPR
jgi:xanthine dehydrogenase accessory factor